MSWINTGDCNTKFFHQSTMQRRQKNKILRIKNDENCWIDEEVGAIGKFEEYF